MKAAILDTGRFLLYWLILQLLALTLLGMVATESTWTALGALIALFAPPILSFALVRRRRRRLSSSESEERQALARLRFEERERLIEAVQRYRGALQRNIHRAVKKNDYGAVTEDKTSQAIEEFLLSVGVDSTVIGFDDAEGLVREYLSSPSGDEFEREFDPLAVPIDGHSFERWVADSLCGFGWEAETTSSGADQGIDVIARRPGSSLGIQCKLYSSAVGNRAVQEALAGKRYYALDEVAVLTNADFTQSAKDLARMNEVYLFSHHEIPRIHEIMAGKQQA